MAKRLFAPHLATTCAITPIRIGVDPAHATSPFVQHTPNRSERTGITVQSISIKTSNPMGKKAFLRDLSRQPDASKKTNAVHQDVVNPEKTGFFLSFEGIDGAGKSSHIHGVAQMFRDWGQTVVLTREPGGTDLAEKLRALALNDPMDALTEALLMFAARRDHLQRVIEPALARGDVVICDRFTDSTFAYQGGGRGFDMGILTSLEQMVQARPDGQGLRQPDMTLWFDLAPQTAAMRLTGARVPDKFESQPVDFFQAVADGYQARMNADPERFVRIDAGTDRATVWESVRLAIVHRMGMDFCSDKRRGFDFESGAG
jgi:dTMP kinase